MESPFVWLFNNTNRFLDKKARESGVGEQWHPLILFYHLGDYGNCFVGDPEVFESIVKQGEAEIIDKSELSPLKTIILDRRVNVNVLTLSRCIEQKKRRRAMTHGLTGSHHFKILDKIIAEVMAGFHKKMKTASQEKKVVDLR